MGKVLIVDDHLGVCKTLYDIVEEMGHEADYTQTLQGGLERIKSIDFDVVLLDVNMPDGSGLELLPKIRGVDRSPEVIIITGKGDPDGAELALTNGAWDYIQKPLFPSKIVLPIKRALKYRQRIGETQKTSTALNLKGIIGHSRQMQSCFNALATVAANEINVLITGETGTGKELFGRACHENSSRSKNHFVAVDCAAMPEALAESILFGHKKGAFTGADKSQDGMIRMADGGTLFLDEIGELPLSMQKKFLRVLQERRYRPVGEQHEIKSDFRLISATNRDLEQMAKQGKFREDLLFRIRTHTIELPPLRKRTEDIKDLVFYYLAKCSQKQGYDAKGFTPDFLEAILAYSWPGNVRELINAVEAAIVESIGEPTVTANHLPLYVRIKVAKAAFVLQKNSASDVDCPNPPVPGSVLGTYKSFRESAMVKIEQEYLRRLVKQAKGSIKEACRISGLGRTRLYTLLKKHEISRFGWN